MWYRWVSNEIAVVYNYQSSFYTFSIISSSYFAIDKTASEPDHATANLHQQYPLTLIFPLQYRVHWIFSTLICIQEQCLRHVRIFHDFFTLSISSFGTHHPIITAFPFRWPFTGNTFPIPILCPNWHSFLAQPVSFNTPPPANHVSPCWFSPIVPSIHDDSPSRPPPEWNLIMQGPQH